MGCRAPTGVTLEAIRSFMVPRSIVTDTELSLQAAGNEGYELFVLWSGVADADTFRIHTAHVPKQTSYQTEDGLLVRVDGPALHELNMWLFENHEMLAIQVHAHPSDAYHSQTDDAFPIMTTLGGLSIVAADFAFDGLLTSHTAAYRLAKQGWDRIRKPARSPLIGVVD
jgi:hypothetical protein